MRLINRIMEWFKKKQIQIQNAGPVFKPIFRKVTSGTKIKSAIDNG